MLNVFLNFSYTHSKDLPLNFLPIRGLTVIHNEKDNEKIQAFEKIISKFNINGDSLLTEIFQKFYIDTKLTFRIILDKGLAHFIGFPRDRSTLPNLREKWESAEKTLAESLVKLDSDDISDNEKENIILKSNTGPFWNKYGAISGMFRIARIYSLQGSEGLTLIIENGQLLSFQNKFN
jgi:hypothetical protein